MKRLGISIAIGLVLAGSSYANDLTAGAGFYANAKEVFRPLLADPREIQFGVRMVTPVAHTAQGEVMAGDYFGLYRWVLPWQDSYMQWSAAGGVFGRFDLVAEQKDFEVVDFAAHMPIDLRVGGWSLRLDPYHISSHLGDDYLARTRTVTDKYTFDSVKTLVAFEPTKAWRFYGGYNYIVRNKSAGNGRLAAQGGAEWASRWLEHGHVQFFSAADYQSWARTAWNPTINTQIGIRLARRPDDKQALSLYTGYGAGHMDFGQFYLKQESHWVLGVRFDIP